MLPRVTSYLDVNAGTGRDGSSKSIMTKFSCIDNLKADRLIIIITASDPNMDVGRLSALTYLVRDAARQGSCS